MCEQTTAHVKMRKSAITHFVDGVMAVPFHRQKKSNNKGSPTSQVTFKGVFYKLACADY